MEEVEGWVDAWQEAREGNLEDASSAAALVDAPTPGTALAVALQDRARARAERMERVAVLRITPEAANEEAAAERTQDDADNNDRTSSRSGRTIRRPAQLSL